MNTYVVTEETEGYLTDKNKQIVYAGFNKDVAFSNAPETCESRLILDVWFNDLIIKSFSRNPNENWRVLFDKMAIAKKEVEDYSRKLKKAQELVEMIEKAELV
ncbi:hypothetical protein [Bacillus velezensis]|uniref:hypothetical protein n=1 Tax=Bacillus velezensis TaxID=492670 RepID=UPI0019D3D0F7|nr:hypothetical protein [Bacillus velezensis]MBN7742742.1 hypothetical protein [Bacillus velezensis]MDW0355717.1 hypothetical protein [Bacillus velezensis]MEE1861633.1 hypothetical protein [Bacillus velezensis]